MDARALTDSLVAERARFQRLVRARVGSDAEAADIVQTALLRAFEGASSLASEERALAWFYRILLNLVADHHRRGARGETVPVDDELPDEPPVLANACCCSVRLLDELRPSYAEVLRRVDLQGEDTGAVAASLGLTTGNLHVRLFRARRALREAVSQHCGVDSLTPCLDCACAGEGRCGDG